MLNAIIKGAPKGQRITGPYVEKIIYTDDGVRGSYCEAESLDKTNAELYLKPTATNRFNFKRKGLRAAAIYFKGEEVCVSLSSTFFGFHGQTLSL
jgi:hypothetical protein